MFINMDDKDNIIYLALCHLLNSYNQLLVEEKDLSEEELSMIEYIISRTEGIIPEYAAKVENLDTTIKRPQWP